MGCASRDWLREQGSPDEELDTHLSRWEWDQGSGSSRCNGGGVGGMRRLLPGLFGFNRWGWGTDVPPGTMAQRAGLSGLGARYSPLSWGQGQGCSGCRCNGGGWGCGEVAPRSLGLCWVGQGMGCSSGTMAQRVGLYSLGASYSPLQVGVGCKENLLELQYCLTLFYFYYKLIQDQFRPLLIALN